MDLGREVKKVKNEFYSIKYFLKEKGEIQRSTRPKYGKIFVTNIDSKGRIYIPKKLPEADILDDRIFMYFHGILAISAFRNIVYLHPTEEENKRIEREIEEGREPGEIYDPWVPTELRILDRLDTKVLIEIYPQITRKHPLDFHHENEIQVNFKPHYILTQMKFTERKIENGNKKSVGLEKNKGYATIDYVDRWMDGEFGYDKKKKSRRYRLKIPRFYLNFCEIDKYSDKIVLFSMEDELEIWSLRRWNDFVDKRIWLSEEGKFIIKSEEEQTQLVTARDNPFVKLMISDKKIDEVD